MGWYTQIIHIIEDVDSKVNAVKISRDIFEEEGKYNHQNNGYLCYVKKKSDNNWSLYYYYEKRKSFNYDLPLKLLQNYRDIHITVLSCPESWTGDAAQVMRFSDGECYDCYGIYYKNKGAPERYKVLTKALTHSSLLFVWYRKNGFEQKLRDSLPKNTSITNENFDTMHEILEISDTDFLVAHSLLEESLPLDKMGWIPQELTFIPTYKEYTENYAALASKKIPINEKSLSAAVMYNPIITGWENELAAYFEWQLLDLNRPFSTYTIKVFKKSGICTIRDLELALEKNLDNVFERYRPHSMRSKSVRRFKGFTVGILWRGLDIKSR